MSKRAKKSPKTKRRTPYEKVKHLIGIFDSGGKRLSENTGEKFHELLLKDQAEERRDVYRHC